MSMKMLLQAFLVTMATCLGVGATPHPPCELGQYFDRPSGECEICSQCQVNEIIREPCTFYKDTVCGPFYEFEFFNQGSSYEDEKNKNKDVNLFKLPTTRGPGSPRSQGDKIHSVGPSVQDETVRWKELCYGLITALVILALVFAAYVIVAHIQISKLRAKAKAAATTTTAESTDEETVYCYTHMLPSICQKFRTKSSAQGRTRVLTPIYRPGQARRASPGVERASPNEYVLQVGPKAEPQPGEVRQQLLPIIPEMGGASQDEDHVRVLYTS